ncbi:unnamed protein product [Plutella xylostella]|uniref:(diamondback moth) hypothetical protein n=1 Tax=Plutella xylostella TaxID=51655 RepID=A0A8S4GI24_PLUXY|nr:unnamed protein product [Plutella xylostella]
MQWLDDFVNKLKLIDGRVKDLEATKVELATTKEQLLSIQRSLLAKDQWSRANNVEIKGVPMKKTENLFKLVEAISTHVNYDFPKSQINYVSRLPTYNSKEKSILISFVNRYVKEDFVAAARGMKSIQASDIGFNDSNNRIFVNDHLSSEQKKLLNETKTAAKIKQYLYVWNVRGLRTKTEECLRNVLLNNYDIITFTESWLLGGIADSEILDSRYVVYRRDRDYAATGQTLGGGVLIAVKHTLHSACCYEWKSSAEDQIKL